MNQNQRRQRGTILILVVAVLGLLVILGTAFLASSRSDSNAARQMNNAVNLDLATKSVLSEVQNTLFEATLGPPDGSLFTGVWTAGKSYAIGDAVISPGDGRVYKCTALHVAGNGNPPPPAANWGLYTTPANFLVTRNFDYPERGTVIGLSNAAVNPGMRDQSWLAKDTTGTDVSVLNANCFNPSSGAFDIGSSTVGQTPVTSPGGANDGAWYLLPFSTQNGIRYRYSVRILDTNRMANLNVGQAGATLNYNPRVLTSLVLNASTLFDSADDPNHLNVAGSAGVRGRGEELTTSRSVATDQIFATTGAMTSNFPLYWQSRVLSFERFGWSTTNTVYPQAEWFDLSDELELRAYGITGNNYMARPATNHGNAIWPATLGAGITKRQYYTTYSFDRAFSPVTASASVPYSYTNAGITYRWPGNGSNGFWQRKLDVTKYPASAGVTDVIEATIYLMNAMYAAGYSEEECLSYAVNWLAQTDVSRRGSSITTGELRIAPLGGAGTAYTIAGVTTANRYFAYSAQPFINEVALYRTDDNVATQKIKDFAIELMNPYQGASISLDKWRVRVVITDASNVVTSTHIADLTSTAVISAFDPTDSANAAGLLVLHMGGGTGLSLPASPETINFDVALPADIPTTSKVRVFLERPYYTSATQTNVVVDCMGPYSVQPMPTFVSPGPMTQSDVTKRANVAAAGGTPRVASSYDAWLASTPRFETGTINNDNLGKWNTLAASDNIHCGVELTDRLQVATPSTNLSIWNNYNLIGDMSAYSRFANIGGSDIPINNRLRTGVVTDSGVFVEESKLLIDFVSDPRAANLVNLMTTVDRTLDGQDEIGEGVPDSLDEVRTAGRVNLNTASVQVLYALLRGTATLNQMSNLECAQHAAYIVAYRDRTTPPTFVYDSSGPYTYNSSSTGNDPLRTLPAPRLVPDFSNTTRFPGKGIHSLSELAIPFGIADLAIGYDNDGTALYPTTQPASGITPGAMYGLRNATSLGGVNDSSTAAPRGAMWQRLLASATVRSDTFVVYGYLEAVKPNRSYTAGTFNNAGDWYNGAVAPRNPTTSNPLQLVSSRRFIAIVDRSWCNAGRGSATVLPKIVAYKELPR